MGTKATPEQVARRADYLEQIERLNGSNSFVDNQWAADIYAATEEVSTWGVSPENGEWEIDEYGSLTDAMGNTCPKPSTYQPAPATFSLNSTFNLNAPGTEPAPAPDSKVAAPEPEPTFPPPPVPPSAPSPFGNKKGRR